MELSLSYLDKENAFLLEGKMSKVDGKILLYLESNEPFPYTEEKEGVIGNDFLSLFIFVELIIHGSPFHFSICRFEKN